MRSVLRTMLAMSAAIGCVTALVTWLFPPAYASTATFVVESNGDQKLSGLAMLASEFGVSKALESSRSPRFYVAALRSRRILSEVLATRFPAAEQSADATGVPLSHLLVPEYAGTARDREAALKRLAKSTAVTIDPQTSIVSIEVRSERRDLAAGVARTYLRTLDQYNREYRQTRSKRRRTFLEVRVAAVRRELAMAENALRDFMLRNRAYQVSPSATTEYQRLSREVTAKQDVLAALVKQYETARVDEVDDQPSISVLDQPEPAADRPSYWPFLLGLVAFVLTAGLVLVGSWVDRRVGVRRLLRALATGPQSAPLVPPARAPAGAYAAGAGGVAANGAANGAAIGSRS